MRVAFDSESTVELWPGVFFCRSEIRLRGTAMCPCCLKEQLDFSVAGFNSVAMRQARFCSKCLTIVGKPQRFVEAAEIAMEVEVELPCGAIETLGCKHANSWPLNVWHYGCRVQDHSPMRLYQTVIVSPNVFGFWFECAACLRERHIRYRIHPSDTFGHFVNQAAL